MALVSYARLGTLADINKIYESLRQFSFVSLHQWPSRADEYHAPGELQHLHVAASVICHFEITIPVCNRSIRLQRGHILAATTETEITVEEDTVCYCVRSFHCPHAALLDRCHTCTVDGKDGENT